MTFVLDASVTICWLMPDEQEPAADAILTKLSTEGAIVPAIWWYEVRNALLINERKARLDTAKTNAALSLLGKLAISIDIDPNESRLIDLSRRHALTAYDAGYLEAAHRRQIGLATFDAAMAKAARHEGIALLVAPT